MKAPIVRAALISGLLLVGCVSQTGTPTTQFHVQSAATQASYTAAVTPGTVSLSWTPPSLVNDGNLSSAWGPNQTLTTGTPSLTLTLDQACYVTSIAAKVSLGQTSSPSNARVLIDVYAWVNGAWVQIGNGLNPPETVLTTLDVTDTTTDRLRIDFRRTTGFDLQLFVCAIDVFCGNKPTPTPTYTPKPTPTPTYTPKPTPTPLECCKVTGGGWVDSPNTGRNDRTTFGFVAQTNPGRGVTGNIQVVDHPTGTNFHGRVTGIACDDTTVTFTGTLRGGGTFTAVVTDNGEPGSEDVFSFTTSTGFTVTDTLGEDGPRGGGNIQIHEGHCD